MITLFMFLFLAGGQPPTQPTTAKRCEITGDSRVECAPKTYTYCCGDKSSIAPEDEGVQKPSPIAPHRKVVKLTSQIKHKKKLNKAHEGLWGAGDNTERPGGTPYIYKDWGDARTIVIGDNGVEHDTDVSVGDPCGVDICASPSAASSGYLAVPTNSGMTGVKLSDDEYTHLQALRQAVADEENRLAVKYGAHIGVKLCHPDHACFTIYPLAPDHVEYHGQFLLIEKAKP